MSDIRIIKDNKSIIAYAIRKVAPGVNDDSFSDCIAGITHWINTVAGLSYICSSDDKGAAVWISEVAAAATNATGLASEITRATAAEALALIKASNLSDLANAATARTNLGVDSLANLVGDQTLNQNLTITDGDIVTTITKSGTITVPNLIVQNPIVGDGSLLSNIVASSITPGANGSGLVSLTPANISAGTLTNLDLNLNGSNVIKGNPYRSRVASDLTNSTTTFSNMTGITSTLVSGRKYTGKLVIKCNNSASAEGIKLDFNGGSMTISSFWAAAADLVGGTNVLGTGISTSLAGVINFSTITGETVIEVNFSFVCNGTGTFIPRFAENSHAAGTLTVELGSFMWVEDTQ